MSAKRVQVSLVVFPECDPSIIYGVFDTLWAAGRFLNGINKTPEAPIFEPRLIAAEPGPLELITGVKIIPQDSIDEVERTDIVFVPNVMVATSKELAALDRRLIDWIKRMHARGAQLYAACGGSLVLAEAGLLDGQQATTHWTYVPLFRANYPEVELCPERILVQNGPGHNVVCSGGASSWQDLALLLIAKHAGTEEAIRLSKMFLYQWHRDGQLPYKSMMQNVDHGDAVVLRCQTWLAHNYHRLDLIAELVRYSGLPKRTFDRRFRAVTGYSPLAYVQTLRIEEAKQMLETSAIPVEAIAREVGYEDAASFRRLFRRYAGMTPGDYRRKFQLPKLVAQSAARPAPQRRPPSLQPAAPRRRGIAAGQRPGASAA